MQELLALKWPHSLHKLCICVTRMKYDFLCGELNFVRHVLYKCFFSLKIINIIVSLINISDLRTVFVRNCWANSSGLMKDVLHVHSSKSNKTFTTPGKSVATPCLCVLENYSLLG